MVLRVFRHHCEPSLRNSPGAQDRNKRERRALPPTLIEQENSMNRKMILVGLAAASLAASAAPASAQGFSVGVGSGDYGYGGWYGDYGYYRPGVSIGFGTPAYDDWRYGSYAAAPCTCATPYRSARVAPGYRSYAYGEYPSDYDYAYYPYNDYYGGSYASVGVGWSDDSWRGRRVRDRDRDRFTREDRVRVGNRDFRNGREEVRDRGGISRASTRTSETRTMTRGGAEFRGGANGDVRGGARGEIRGSAGRGNGAATVGSGGGGRRGGDNR